MGFLQQVTHLGAGPAGRSLHPARWASPSRSGGPPAPAGHAQRSLHPSKHVVAITHQAGQALSVTQAEPVMGAWTALLMQHVGTTAVLPDLKHIQSGMHSAAGQPAFFGQLLVGQPASQPEEPPETVCGRAEQHSPCTSGSVPSSSRECTSVSSRCMASLWVTRSCTCSSSLRA